MANDKAVLVGINRYQYFNGLDGCLQDVTNMAAVLTGRFGFPAENVRTITDEDATKDAISDRMMWLLDGASPGDRLVFHFSGHGSFDSPDGNPPDGIDGDGLIYDGIICLHDFNFGQPGSYFTSEELRDWTKRLPTGGELVVVLDSCHSGGGTREIRPLDGGRPFLIDAEVTQRGWFVPTSRPWPFQGGRLPSVSLPKSSPPWRTPTRRISLTALWQTSTTAS